MPFKSYALSALVVLPAILAGCGAQPGMRQVTSNTLRARQAAPSFQKDVLPLLKNNCASCHNAGRLFAPLPMFEKDGTPRTEAISGNIDRIVTAIESGRMPPRKPGSISPDQIAMLKAWAAAGTPVD
ncbi:MAG: cytochrome c [Candidatus Sericytochromatia bacterium]|nr:cytochrome c [Candidatus Tanganyikabacteria bacterium]